MTGTTTQNYLSLKQKITVGLIWLGMLGVMMVLTAFAPNSYDSPVAAIAMLVLIVFAFVATFRITTRAEGKPYVRITSSEGVRGEFSVTRYGPIIATYLMAMLSLVGIMGMVEEVPGSRLMWGWGLTALIPLCVYGIVLLTMRGRVIAFRVEDDGSLAIRRGNADWKPFRITDYGRIIGRTMSGRYGGSSPSKVEFLDPVDGQHKAAIPLMLIRSRKYKTVTYGVVIDDFFRKACEKAGYRVNTKNGWTATGK